MQQIFRFAIGIGTCVLFILLSIVAAAPSRCQRGHSRLFIPYLPVRAYGCWPLFWCMQSLKFLMYGCIHGGSSAHDGQETAINIYGCAIMAHHDFPAAQYGFIHYFCFFGAPMIRRPRPHYPVQLCDILRRPHGHIFSNPILGTQNEEQGKDGVFPSGKSRESINIHFPFHAIVV